MKCGAGKTLVTLLAAHALGCRRPVLMVPAALRERTRRDAGALSAHWRVWLPRLLGYEEMGRVSRKDELDAIAPDALICDEAHRLSNTDAAVTRRVMRYLRANPGCKLVALSGTLLGDDLLRVQHLAAAALREGSPLPLARAECEEWQAALFPEILGRHPLPGALRAFGPDPAAGLLEKVRATPGVVATQDIGCRASLEFSLWRPLLPGKLAVLIKQVRLEGRRPDGVDLLDDFAGLPGCLSQLALGFWYRWDPPAPERWLTLRRDWWMFVRDVLADHAERGHLAGEGGTLPDGHLDSELQVRAAYPAEAAEWLSVRDTFRPNPVPVWESGDVLDQAAAWVKREATLVWLKNRAVGAELERRGLPYHGQDALDAKGRHVEQARGTVAASIASCGTGCNLQHYRRNLVLNLPGEARGWEQMLARTHREGQEADSVEVAIVRVIPEHTEGLRRVREQADALTAMGDTQRLSYGTWE
jgi:hypothetical protein